MSVMLFSNMLRPKCSQEGSRGPSVGQVVSSGVRCSQKGSKGVKWGQVGLDRVNMGSVCDRVRGMVCGWI